MRLAAAGLLALVACGTTPRPLDAAGHELLRQAAHRDAWQGVAALELAGTAHVLGRDEPFRLWVTRDGRFRREVDGPLGRTEVYDGERAWLRDLSGIGRELDLGGREEAPLLAALRTGAWLDDASLVLEQRTEDRLRITRPGTPLDFELLLDERTDLPRQVIDHSGGGASVATFSDWRPVGGVPVPFDLTIAGSGGEQTSYRVERTAALAELPTGLFEPPPADPGDVTFDASVPDEVEVWRARTGHLFVRPRLEGREVGWFLFDSGAGAMVVDRALASELELEHLGEVLAVGVSGRELTPLVGAESFSLGPLSWDGLVLVELDLSFVGELLGVPVSGIVGHDLFGRAVVDLRSGPRPVSPGDLDGDGEPDPAPVLVGGGRVALLDPATWQPPTDAALAPLTFEGHTPCVSATFPTLAGPVTAWFRLDTGANGSVTFHAPAVKRHRLLANRDVSLARFGGVGGDGSGYTGELEWFELAGRRFETFRCAFATTEVGTFADPYTAGNIGQELLEPFRLLFDYPGERIGLIPR